MRGYRTGMCAQASSELPPPAAAMPETHTLSSDSLHALNKWNEMPSRYN